jgi:hypothetical protein
MRMIIINATRTDPPTAAPAIVAKGRDLELVESDRDNDVADGWYLTVTYAVGWTLPSPRLVGAALEVNVSKDAVGMGILVKDTSDA